MGFAAGMRMSRAEIRRSSGRRATRLGTDRRVDNTRRDRDLAHDRGPDSRPLSDFVNSFRADLLGRGELRREIREKHQRAARGGAFPHSEIRRRHDPD